MAPLQHPQRERADHHVRYELLPAAAAAAAAAAVFAFAAAFAAAAARWAGGGRRGRGLCRCEGVRAAHPHSLLPRACSHGERARARLGLGLGQRDGVHLQIEDNAQRTLSSVLLESIGIEQFRVMSRRALRFVGGKSKILLDPDSG